MSAPTTQHHLDIEDITQNIVIHKDGSCALVLKIGAVNFNLLSEEEQDAIIFSYAALLNSLTFPIQILIRSQRKDITNYLKLLEKQQTQQSNPIIRQRLNQYHVFVQRLVKERQVLDKKCYAVIPFLRTELGLAPPSLLNPKKETGLPFDKNYIIEKALAALEPKRDHLVRQFGRIGLSARQLSTRELIELFYTIYNPHSGPLVIDQSLARPAPIVEAATPSPSPA
jgi:hypothetical protein